MSKSVEHSRLELEVMHAEFLRRVLDVNSLPGTTPLSEEFQLYALREAKGRQITGDNYITATLQVRKVECINQFGYFDICAWVTNYEKNIVFVSPEIYSRGTSGKETGHGKNVLIALHALLQNVANQSGFTVICFSSLNVGSEQLNATLGYPITQLMKNHVSKFKDLVPHDQFINWLELLETLTHNSSYYYQFVPEPNHPIETIPEETLQQIIRYLKLDRASRDSAMQDILNQSNPPQFSLATLVNQVIKIFK